MPESTKSALNGQPFLDTIDTCGKQSGRRVDSSRIWHAVLAYAQLSHEMWTGKLPEGKSLNEHDPDAWPRCLREIEASVPTQQAINDESFDFHAHLQRQREWSEGTFGPGSRAQGVVDHIRKELVEIEEDPSDLSEWIDVVILALAGAWRSGATPDQIIAALAAKQAENEGRTWPDWRTADPNKAIEHDRNETR